MNKTHIALTGFLFALPLIVSAGGGAAKSGLAVGEMVSAFEPTHVTGPDAGSKTCPVCKYGNTPAVQVWVNGDKIGNVAKIADALEGAIKMEGPSKLKGFVVFIKPTGESDAKIQNLLRMVANQCHLQHVGLLFVDGSANEAVGEYKINTAASVKNTVIVYRDRKVSANFVNLVGDDGGIKALKMAMMKTCGM
ncbi:MAG: hypothetical protein P4L46_09370 [Fimbriimonas sp.]|nr:hypothetical protein [Fimbriimonas sp.]